MSFLVAEARARMKQNMLLRVRELVAWEDVVRCSGGLGRSGMGPSAYDMGAMLRALVLQSWYSLSDPALEEALRVRLDFMLFTGFEREVPDETTLCRFRNLLVTQGALDAVLDEANRQLQAQGLMMRPSAGAVLDATLVESAARGRRKLEAIVEDRREDEAVVAVDVTSERLSADPDATWLKKGKESHFGYKVFAVVDAERGYIERVHTTPAHVSEMTSLKDAIGSLKPSRLYADKGSASADNRAFLRQRKIKSAIMHKAQRGHPLSARQKRSNRLISTVRYIVEQAFGTLKRRFHMGRSPYMTTTRVHGWVQMKALAFNLLKAVNALHAATAAPQPLLQ